jgi:hypothetical protein
MEHGLLLRPEETAPRFEAEVGATPELAEDTDEADILDVVELEDEADDDALAAALGGVAGALATGPVPAEPPAITESDAAEPEAEEVAFTDRADTVDAISDAAADANAAPAEGSAKDQRHYGFDAGTDGGVAAFFADTSPEWDTDTTDPLLDTIGEEEGDTVAARLARIREAANDDAEPYGDSGSAEAEDAVEIDAAPLAEQAPAEMVGEDADEVAEAETPGIDVETDDTEARLLDAIHQQMDAPTSESGEAEEVADAVLSAEAEDAASDLTEARDDNDFLAKANAETRRLSEDEDLAAELAALRAVTSEMPGTEETGDAVALTSDEEAALQAELAEIAAADATADDTRQAKGIQARLLDRAGPCRRHGPPVRCHRRPDGQCRNQPPPRQYPAPEGRRGRAGRRAAPRGGRRARWRGQRRRHRQVSRRSCPRHAPDARARGRHAPPRRAHGAAGSGVRAARRPRRRSAGVKRSGPGASTPWAKSLPRAKRCRWRREPAAQFAQMPAAARPSSRPRRSPARWPNLRAAPVR